MFSQATGSSGCMSEAVTNVGPTLAAASLGQSFGAKGLPGS